MKKPSLQTLRDAAVYFDASKMSAKQIRAALDEMQKRLGFADQHTERLNELLKQAGV